MDSGNVIVKRGAKDSVFVHNYLDFGAGFYTTTSYEQAERWARIKMRREKKTSVMCPFTNSI